MNPYSCLFTISLTGCLVISGCTSHSNNVMGTPVNSASNLEKFATPGTASTPAPAQSPEPIVSATPASPAAVEVTTTDDAPSTHSLMPVQPIKTDPTPTTASQDQPAPVQQETLTVSRIVGMDGLTGYGIADGKLLYTQNAGKSWEIELPEGISEHDHLIMADFHNPFSGFAYYMTDKRQLLSTHPLQDGGGLPAGWETALLPTSEAWEASQDVTVLSNYNYFDASYVLLTSSPALGQMAKSLYKTPDRGKSWIRVGDITDKISGYPTGISFRSPQEGWITATYHGQDAFPLYRTKDGGQTWIPQQVDIPDEYKDGYANTLPPVFDMENNNHGIIIAEFVKGENRSYILYESHDSGETWLPLAYRIKDIQPPPVLHFNELIDGRAISMDGNTIYTMDTYNKENWSPIQSETNLEGATQLFLRSDGFGWVFIKGHTMITMDGGKTWSDSE